MAGRTIHLLGRPCVEPAPADGRAVRGNKPWAILAYLALERRRVSRRELINLLFDEASDPDAALRWNLAQARRILGDATSLTGPEPALPDEGLTFDVDTVIAGRWSDAVELPGFGREVLDEMRFDTSPRFELWLVGARRRLSAATEALLREAATASLAAGAVEPAARYALRLVAIAPLDDAHQEILIRTYAAAGDREGARRQLEQAVRLYREEVGRDPAPEVFLAADTGRHPWTRRPSASRVRALLDAAQSQMVAGSVGPALRVLEQACDEAQATGDEHLQAIAQLQLGSVLADAGTGRHQQAELALFAAIELAERTGDRGTAAAAYRNLAASDVFRGLYGRVLARLDEAERLHDGSDRERVELSTVRGVALLDLGDGARAIEELRRAIAADPEETHPFLPILLVHTGRAHLLGGDHRAALERLERARYLTKARAWAGVTAAPLALLGHLAIADGDLENADAVLDEAYESACQVGDPCWETWASHGLAKLAAARGDEADALRRFAEADERSDPMRGGHLWSRVWALADAARVAAMIGDARATAWRDEALLTAQRAGMRELAASLVEA
jgi:DNA-binding SARP family transcriptional activator